MGTGNSSKDFLGLEAIVDNSTNVATYGSLTRSSYDTLDSTVTASSGTLTLAKMSTLYNAVSSGSQTPTVGLTTEAVFALYEQLLQPQERIAKTVGMMKGGGARGLNTAAGLQGGTGFTGLTNYVMLSVWKLSNRIVQMVLENIKNFNSLKGSSYAMA